MIVIVVNVSAPRQGCDWGIAEIGEYKFSVKTRPRMLTGTNSEDTLLASVEAVVAKLG